MTVVYTPQMRVEDLSVSVVVYRPDHALLARTLASLSVACRALRQARPGAAVHCWIVDNGGLDATRVSFDSLRSARIECSVLGGHGNVGYGRGHNLAIDRIRSRYHLVLNPDVDLEPDALLTALAFLDVHPKAGLLTPSIADERGRHQYLCRRYPALLDLFVRGFLPARLRAAFSQRLARYEMRAEIDESVVLWGPPIVSGCFMLFRTDVLRRLGGFDPRYFLYFEDYDLSLRAHNLASVAYVPTVRIVHHGGGASRKGWAHIRMFAASACKFYNRFGWKWL